MKVYRVSSLVAFFVKSVTVLAAIFGPLSSAKLWLQERDYAKHAVTVVSEPVSMVPSVSSATDTRPAGWVTGDITFIAADGQRYTATRTLTEEGKWRAKEPDGRLRVEYLPKHPEESMRVVGSHLDPVAPLVLAGAVIVFGLALWRVV